MKTARLNLLIEPDEKARIEAQAARSGVSVSELVRRATAAYAPPDAAASPDEPDDAALGLLVAELAAMVGRMEARLDARLAEIAALRRETADRAALAAEARAEIERRGLVWPFAA